MRSRIATVVLAVALGASGCGSDDVAEDGADGASSASSSTSATPESSPADTETGSAEATPSSAPTSEAVPDGPECGAVWVDGAKLPRGYKGCLDAGAFVPADKLGCSSGQALIRYADLFWAVAGGRIHETAGLQADADYKDSVSSCRG